MDPIKEAFSKIKGDMDSLKSEIKVIRDALLEIHENQTIQAQKRPPISQQTDQQTHKYGGNYLKTPLEGLYSPNIPSSIGNEGVPTDRPTNTQTNRHPPISTGKPQKTEFQRANEALESLSSIKREIRLKFKRLTSQEMTVFSMIYSLEEQKMSEITYKLLAEHLNLSESSIRDYINKLIIKGVPITKTRQNNKTILLNISSDLKNIASLEGILRLREL